MKLFVTFRFLFGLSITFSCMLIPINSNSQNWFTNAHWTYMQTQYYCCPFKEDHFLIGEIQSLGNVEIDSFENATKRIYTKLLVGSKVFHLREENGIVYYLNIYGHNLWKREFKLFDFNRNSNDTFQIDMQESTEERDEIRQQVNIVIDSICYIPVNTSKDSLREFFFRIIDTTNTFYMKPIHLTEKVLIRSMGQENELNLLYLFFTAHNLGGRSKPYLACYSNPDLNLYYLDSVLIKNNLSCLLTTDLKDVQNTNITVSPNPFNDLIILRGLPNDKYFIQLTDYLGRVIQTKRIESGPHEVILFPAKEESGIYFLQITGDQINYYKKLVHLN